MVQLTGQFVLKDRTNIFALNGTVWQAVIGNKIKVSILQVQLNNMSNN
jgi:hypothetical protein